MNHCHHFKHHNVHVCKASLSDFQQCLPYFLTILSHDELLTLQTFRFFKDKKQYLISRAILRILLGRYLDMPPKKIEFSYGIWGKPSLVNNQSLYFNISHAKDCVVVALSPHNEVGIDIEFIDIKTETDIIIKSLVQSISEKEYWERIKKEERNEFFFRFWVCKEAYLKALGTGWRLDNSNLPNHIIHFLLQMDAGKAPITEKNICIFYPKPHYIGAIYVKDTDQLVPYIYSYRSEESAGFFT